MKEGFHTDNGRLVEERRNEYACISSTDFLDYIFLAL